MVRSSSFIALAAAALLIATGCSGRPRAPDAGRDVDGGLPSDGGPGTVDAGDLDAGRDDGDASSPSDAGDEAESGSGADGGDTPVLDDAGALDAGDAPADAGASRTAVVCDDTAVRCLRVTLPGGEMTVVGPFVVEVAMEPFDDAAQLVLRVADVVVGASTGSGIAVSVDPLLFQDGPIPVRADAMWFGDVDDGALTATLPLVSGAQPPLLQVTPFGPIQTAVAPAEVSFTAVVSDPLGVASLTLFLDGLPQTWPLEGLPHTTMLPRVESYPHDFTATFVARDTGGIGARRTVHVLQDVAVARVGPSSTDHDPLAQLTPLGAGLAARSTAGRLSLWSTPAMDAPAARTTALRFAGMPFLAVDDAVYAWDVFTSFGASATRTTIDGGTTTLFTFGGDGTYTVPLLAPFLDADGYIQFVTATEGGDLRCRSFDLDGAPVGDVVVDVAAGFYGAFVSADGRLVPAVAEGGPVLVDPVTGDVLATDPLPEGTTGGIVFADAQTLLVETLSYRAGQPGDPDAGTGVVEVHGIRGYDAASGAEVFGGEIAGTTAGAWNVNRAADGALRITVLDGMTSRVLTPDGTSLRQVFATTAWPVVGGPPWVFSRTDEVVGTATLHAYDADGGALWTRVGPRFHTHAWFADGDVVVTTSSAATYARIERIAADGTSTWVTWASHIGDVDDETGVVVLDDVLVVATSDFPAQQRVTLDVLDADSGARRFAYALENAVPSQQPALRHPAGDALVLPFDRVYTSVNGVYATPLRPGFTIISVPSSTTAP